MSSGAVVEANRAVVLAALQITAELFDARESLEATNTSIAAERVRAAALPPAKRSRLASPVTPSAASLRFVPSASIP